MKTFFTLLLGAIAGALMLVLLGNPFEQENTSETDDPSKPLYWVAPMDPNFRRDGPGKSPMGMDLVPVYADDAPASAPGTVSISPDVEQNLGVKTAPVRLAPLAVPMTTVGYVQFDENRLVHVHPRVEGWVDKLFIKASGENVEQGEALYALYSPELVNAQEEYLLARSRSNTALMGAAESRLRALQMPVSALELLKQKGTVQQTVTYYAPQSGVVANLQIREGFFVKPGTTLMSIGALEEVWVEAEIFERQAHQVRAGQTVTMSLDFIPGKTWQGQVDYIYPTLDAQTRTVRVRLRFANPRRLLKPNMFAEVTIQSGQSGPTLQVPSDAVIRTGNQDRVVLALGEGQFKSVAVTLGRVTPTHSEILDGLQRGDEVVISAQFLLDSESSIDSDFRRMTHSQATVQQADTRGVINLIDRENYLATIHRESIAKWGRGAATVEFELSRSIDTSLYEKGDSVAFTFEIRDGRFVIIAMRHEAGHHHD